jgi:protein Mpv17
MRVNQSDEGVDLLVEHNDNGPAQKQHMLSGVPANVWTQYEGLLQERPLLTKALTSFGGFAIGDVLAQHFVEGHSEFDWARFLRLSSFGFLIHGPSSHWFYGTLDKLMPDTSARTVLIKVVIDQTMWSFCFSVLFFSYVAGLEKGRLRYIWRKLRDEALTQVTGSWSVWPVAHAINFRLVPPSQRVLFVNLVQIGYNVFLSIIANRS